MNLQPHNPADTDYRWRFQRIAEHGARWVAVFTAIAVVLPTAWLSISEVLLLLLWLFSGRYALKFDRIRNHPVALIALALFSLLLIGTLYSRVDWIESVDTLDNYLPLLFIPIVVSIFDRPVWRERAYLALILGVLIVAVVVSLRGLDVLSPAIGKRMAFKTHITEGVMLSFGCLLIAHRAIASPKSRIAWLLALGAVVFLLFFVYGGKTGYIVFFSLTLLFVWQILGFRAVLPALFLVIGAASLFWVSSDTFRDRVGDGLTGLMDYQPGSASDSVGVRIEYYKNTLSLIQEHPLTGVGTGGFASAYREVVQDMNLPKVLITVNPHNQYLLLTAELGILGGLLFVLLLVTQWVKSFGLDRESCYLAQGLVVAMGTGCLFNSLLLDFTEGAWFGLVSGIVFSGLRSHEGRQA